MRLVPTTFGMLAQCYATVRFVQKRDMITLSVIMIFVYLGVIFNIVARDLPDGKRIPVINMMA